VRDCGVFQIFARAAHDAAQQRVELLTEVRQHAVLQLHRRMRRRVCLSSTSGVNCHACLWRPDCGECCRTPGLQSARAMGPHVLPTGHALGVGTSSRRWQWRGNGLPVPRPGARPAAEHPVVTLRQNIQQVPGFDGVQLHRCRRGQQHALGLLARSASENPSACSARRARRLHRSWHLPTAHCVGEHGVPHRRSRRCSGGSVAASRPRQTPYGQALRHEANPPRAFAEDFAHRLTGTPARFRQPNPPIPAG
jgi:hypothetical protein